MTSTPRLFLAFVLALALAPSAASAQMNAFGYSLTTGVAYDYVAPPSGTPTLALSDDGQVTVALPWTFDWYGVTHNTVTVYANGGLGFSVGSLGTFSSCLPQAVGGDILAYWDDLDPSAAGSVRHWLDTTGGNNRYIVSWEGVPIYQGSTANAGTFQVHLHSDGSVEIHYMDTDFGDPTQNHGADAVIGIQDAINIAAPDELEYSCDTVQGLQGTAISFTTCVDADGDGYGDSACGGADCDDTDPAFNPGVLEICDNALDEDCSGADLVGDGDGDTYDSTACVGGDDCNDNNAAINPGVDADGDGSNVCDDCNDSPGVGQFLFPGNPEVCGDGIDQDCSGSDDLADVDGDTYVNVACGGDDCDDSDAAINVGVDVDADSSNACDDCDDSDATAFPGNPEVCDAGVDNDCDGNVDDVDFDNDGDLAILCGGTDCDDTDPNVGATTDVDGDGANACDDCDDNDANVYPGALELCDTTDSDCDGLDDAFDLDIGGQTGVSQVEGPGAGGVLAVLGAPVVSTLVVVAPGMSVQDLNVDINITYDPTADLVVQLTSPSGTSILLADQAGAIFGSPNFTGTVFDDEATAAIANGTAPFSGSYTPDSPLSAVDLEPADGTWTLTVSVVGFFGFAGGTVNSWNLDFTLQQVDDIDGDGAVDSCGDCDDTDASVYPGAPEICGDTVDQDCDGADDLGDEDGDTYIDATCGGDDCDDGDAALNPGVDVDVDGSNACDDCDDGDAANFPGNLEICADGIDQDCDGSDQSGDVDGDTFISEGCIGGDDCDDNNASVFPGAFDNDGDGYDVCADCYDLGGDNSEFVNPGLTEVCADGLDNDCDGDFDNLDGDGDGFVSTDCFAGDDCDDTDAAINPQTDADGDGFNACTDCDDTDALVFPGTTEVCDDGVDQNCNGADLLGDVDLDGFDSVLCGGDDCDDADAAFNPDATDICDGVDLNCDGETTSTDADNDGFYDAACGGEDCDDDMQSVHPDASEVCDGIDNNCDGALLDGGEDDEDLDGVPFCADDCDDTDDTIFPGAQELCDGIDNDCDGTIDNGVISDGDQDGHDREGCGGDDCDDGNRDSFPGNVEVCTDSIDNDCDGTIDGSDTDCDFDNGCGCQAGGETDRLPVATLALLLGLLGVLARRRSWSAS